jgi:hypothetical protein
MRSAPSLLILVVALSFVSSLGQDSPKPLPGNIKLLDGYVGKAEISKDGQTAKFISRQGFTIQFIGAAPKGFYSKQFTQKTGFVWFKSQEIDGQKLDLGLKDDGEIIAVFDATTRFSARPNSLADLSEFLLIVLSFNAGDRESTTTATSRVPGNIKLLDGYTYERQRGIDSNVGAFLRADGLTFRHDIGRMAANYAFQYFPENFERLRKHTHLNTDAIEREIQYLQGKVEWRLRQKVDGDDLMVVLLKDSTLIAAYSKSSSNFIGKVDSTDKIADFFLTVLTYRYPRK